jgi:hypothetical protein
LYSLSNINVREDKIGEHVACNGEHRNVYKMPMKKRDHLKPMHIYGDSIKINLKGRGYQLNFTGSEQAQW